MECRGFQGPGEETEAARGSLGNSLGQLVGGHAQSRAWGGTVSGFRALGLAFRA